MTLLYADVGVIGSIAPTQKKWIIMLIITRLAYQIMILNEIQCNFLEYSEFFQATLFMGNLIAAK